MNGTMYSEELVLQKNEGSVAQSASRERVEAAESPSFDEIFERYHSMVYSLATHILGDREEALDVSQEVFLTIHRKLETFRGESSLKTWIYTITTNRASNRFRWWSRIRRRGTVSLEEHLVKNPNNELFYNLRSEVQSPEEALAIQEKHAALQRILQELPLCQRIAVILRDIEGLSYEEIASSLDTSLGTVKSRIARGRELLKRRLSNAKS